MRPAEWIALFVIFLIFCLISALLNYRYSRLKDFTPNTNLLVEPSNPVEWGVVVVSGALFMIGSLVAGAFIIGVLLDWALNWQ